MDSIPKSMETQYNELTHYLLKKTDEVKGDSKYIIGIAGSPGSGKTTTAETLHKLLNQASPGIAVMLPMDGFHYYKAQLDKFDDPVEAYKRRGAPYTFWAEGLLNLLKKLHETGEVKAPSFDHRKGDPIEDDIVITKSHKIVIVEGNYVLLKEKPWSDISALFDERWFIECDLDVAMERVRLRHIDQLRLTDEQARIRIATNDRPNGELINTSRVAVDRVIKSG